MRASRLVTTLALPLLMISAAILQAATFRGGSRDFVFEVRGYDPRDLLRGRYLQFQLRIDTPAEREPCDEATVDCCLCLTRVASATAVRAERATCRTARTDCDGALQMQYLGRELRFYVPERDARELERRLRAAMDERRAYAVLAVDRGGEAQVRDLRIDHESITSGSEASEPVEPTREP